jgi:hypothetical protein
VNIRVERSERELGRSSGKLIISAAAVATYQTQNKIRTPAALLAYDSHSHQISSITSLSPPFFVLLIYFCY